MMAAVEAQRDDQRAHLDYLDRESTFLSIPLKFDSRPTLRPVFDCPLCHASMPREKVLWMRW